MSVVGVATEATAPCSTLHAAGALGGDCGCVVAAGGDGG